MSAGLEAKKQSQNHQRLMARLGVSIPRPRLDSVILTEVRRVGSAGVRGTSGKMPPIREVSEPDGPPPSGREHATKRSRTVKPPPPTGANKADGSSPPPLRSGATGAVRIRTRSGKFRPVAGPGGPSKALDGGRPEQAELVSKGVKVTAPATPPPDDASQNSQLDEELSNIMGNILASGERDEKRRAVGNKVRVSRDTWYEDIFEAEHWLALEPGNPQRDVRRELRFIHEQVGIRTDFEVLDVGCGDGRHIVELAATGCSVTGLDLSRSLLEIGLEKANKRDAPVRFIEADMREMNFERRFDLIMCMNSTFGYFDDAENLRILRMMARGLKPGGHLILDVINRDWAVRISPLRTWWDGVDRVVLEETEFEPLSSRVHVKRSILRDGDPNWEQHIRLRAYAVHELPSMMHVTGLQVRSVSGDLAHPGKYIGPTNRRLLVHAVRGRGA